MQATFLAVRAIGAEFAHGLWVASLVGVVLIGALLVTLLVWLTSLSIWWWLLALPIAIALSIAIGLLIVFRLLVAHVRPQQTHRQKKQVKVFVSKLQFASEVTSTPKFIMLFRVVRSIAAPRSDRYLQNILEAKDLGKDFRGVVEVFQGK